MKSLALILCLIALPALAKPLHSPKHSAFLASLGPVMNAASAPAPLRLTWDYPADQITNVIFEVWHTQTPAAGLPLTHYDQVPSGFTLFSIVAAPPISIGGLSQDFFIVRAKSLISGIYSNWNVK